MMWLKTTVSVALVSACFAPGANAQICNSEDPEGGGMFVPAFSTGGAVVCFRNKSDALGLAFDANPDGSECLPA